jgi:hypothetical protein
MARKLGIKAGHLVVLCGAPAGWVVPDLPPDVVTRAAAEPPAAEPPTVERPIAEPPAAEPLPAAAPASAAATSLAGSVQSSAPIGADAASPSSAADVVIAFCRTLEDLTTAIAGYGQVIYPAGSLWIAWPRRAAGHRSDVTDTLIRDKALPLGLVDTKVAALDYDWSGLKLVWRKDRR